MEFTNPSSGETEEQALTRFLDAVEERPRAAFFEGRRFVRERRRHDYPARILGGLLRGMASDPSRPPSPEALQLAREVVDDSRARRLPGAIVVDTPRGLERVDVPARIWQPAHRRIVLSWAERGFVGTPEAAVASFLLRVLARVAAEPQAEWAHAWVDELMAAPGRDFDATTFGSGPYR